MQRSGISVTSIKAWNKIDTFLTSKKLVSICNTAQITDLNIDTDGIGTAIVGNLKSAGLGIKCNYRGVKGSGRTSRKKWVDGKEGTMKSSRDKFKNARAENWWLLRERFRKTYEYRMFGVLYPFEEMISIPDHQDLIEQLSIPLYEVGDDGKIKLESKLDMRKRNVSSPDYADALVICFAEVIERPKTEGRTSSGECW